MIGPRAACGFELRSARLLRPPTATKLVHPLSEHLSLQTLRRTDSLRRGGSQAAAAAPLLYSRSLSEPPCLGERCVCARASRDGDGLHLPGRGDPHRPRSHVGGLGRHRTAQRGRQPPRRERRRERHPVGRWARPLCGGRGARGHRSLPGRRPDAGGRRSPRPLRAPASGRCGGMPSAGGAARAQRPARRRDLRAD